MLPSPGNHSQIPEPMADDNSPNKFTLIDAWCLLIGLALGAGFGALVHSAGVGLGTGLALGVASNMARRRGSQGWPGWLGIYAILVLIAYVLKLTGVLR